MKFIKLNQTEVVLLKELFLDWEDLNEYAMNPSEYEDEIKKLALNIIKQLEE